MCVWERETRYRAFFKPCFAAVSFVFSIIAAVDFGDAETSIRSTLTLFTCFFTSPAVSNSSVTICIHWVWSWFVEQIPAIAATPRWLPSSTTTPT